VQARLKEIGADVVAPSAAHELSGKFLESDIQKWPAAIRAADLETDCWYLMHIQLPNPKLRATHR
jgi:hypothetical protein